MADIKLIKTIGDNMKHPFQKWMDDNNITDVSFYPKNPSESTALSILDDAYNAVMSYENNECVPYVDDTPETFM